MPKQHHCPRCKSTVNSKCISNRHVVRCPTHLSFNEKGRKCPACKAEEERNEARARKEKQALREQQPVPEEKTRKDRSIWKTKEKVGKGDPSKRRGADESHTVSQQAGSGDHNASTSSNNTSPPGVPKWQGNQAYGSTALQGDYGNNDSYSQDWASTTHEQQSIVGDTHDDHICGGHSHHTQGEADNHSSHSNHSQGNSDHDHTQVQRGRTLSDASRGSGYYTTDYTTYDINGYSNTQLSSVQQEVPYGRHVPRAEEESAYTDNGADDFAAGDIYGYDGEDAQHAVAQDQGYDEVYYDYGVDDADNYDGSGRNHGFGHH